MKENDLAHLSRHSTVASPSNRGLGQQCSAATVQTFEPAPAPGAMAAAAAAAPASTLPLIGAYLQSIYPARALEKGMVKDDAEKLDDNFIETSDDLFTEFREVEREGKNFIEHLQGKYGLSKLAFKIAQDLQTRFDAKLAKHK